MAGLWIRSLPQVADFGLGVAETTLGRLKQLAAKCGRPEPKEFDEVWAELTPYGVKITRSRAVEEDEVSAERTLSWAGLESNMDLIPPTLNYLRLQLDEAVAKRGPPDAA